MPPVLFDETIDRDSAHGPTPLILSLHISFEFCRSWQLFILSIHLEQGMAETTKKNHWRVQPKTRRTLEGCWDAWPTWWGEINKTRFAFNLLQIPAQAHWEGGHQIWIIYNTFKLLYYLLHWFSKQLYNMSSNRIYNNLYMLHTTFVVCNKLLFSYITCYIQRYVLVVNCICKMFYFYITFSLTWYITCYICCIVLLRNKGGT